MGMRKDLRHWDIDQIKEEVDNSFPRLKVDIVLKCYKFGYGDMHLDWHCGTYMEITQCVIENPEFQTILNECRSRCIRLWADGQSCIRVVCICGQRSRTPTSIVVSSTLQAVFQQAGYISTGPVVLSSV